eukprot:9480281-Pyramimonas_sp.AAC.2
MLNAWGGVAPQVQECAGSCFHALRMKTSIVVCNNSNEPSIHSVYECLIVTFVPGLAITIAEASRGMPVVPRTTASAAAGAAVITQLNPFSPPRLPTMATCALTTWELLTSCFDEEAVTVQVLRVAQVLRAALHAFRERTCSTRS